MKRFLKILLTALVLSATFSCQTYNGAALQAIRTVAVVSIQGDRRIDVTGFENFESTARGWMKSEAFDLSPAMARIDSAVFTAYARSFPFAFVPERQLLAASEYQALGTDGTKLLNKAAIEVPEGYVRLPATSASAKTLAERLPDADGFLWAQVTYTLQMTGEFKGTRFARMRADLTVTVFDRQGRAVLRHTESAEDATELRIVTIGMMPASDFSSAAIRATASASADMARWLQGRSTR